MRSTQVCVISREAGPGSLEVRTSDIGDPPPGQVRVRIEAAGVSYGDLLFQRGVVPGGPKPVYTPGCDLTGKVEALGSGVTGLAPGQRVAALVVSGGYSSAAHVPAERLVPVPEQVNPFQAAAVVLNCFIAYQMLHRVARVSSGQRVLVHGASGGVGLAFLQLLEQIGGVQVFGTCSSANSELVRRHGAVPIDYRAEDFAGVVRAHGGGLDAVFDHVGGTHFLRSYRLLRRGGCLVAYGQNDALRNGRPSKRVGAVGFLGGIAAPKLVPDGRRTVFYNAWSLEKTQPSAYRADLAGVLSLVAAGKIAPKSVTVMQLADAARAFQSLEQGVAAKIVLDCARRGPSGVSWPLSASARTSTASPALPPTQ
ncbi:MAG TPA: medium chain dehydrogenase/reductase family protein [Streptosporangiaceae bacterium]|nr:medium chain dehydrogenase/reductase family protein [Streptosporangiaceae bacterium]